MDDGQLILAIEVINGTTNGHPVVGDRVTVEIYEHKGLVNTLQGKVGTDGKAVFENVRAADHLIAVANVLHEGMRFSGPAVALKPGQGQVTARVDVFDVSYENSNLSVNTHHLIIKQKGSSLLLTEYIQLINTSDLAISSNDRDDQGRAIVLMIPLPKGFKNFSSSNYLVPEALGFTQEGFYDTMAVPPGDHHIIFSYTLDIKSDTVNITKGISLPTANFMLFSQSAQEGIQGLGEPDGQVVLDDGTLAGYYNRTDLPAGAEIGFEVAGLSTSAGDRASWIVLAVVFGTITILAVLRLLLGKNRLENRTVSP